MTGRDPAEHLQYAFVRRGRLTSLPRRPLMLRAACAFLADRFEAGRRYAEREVNAILADDAPDPATLRRLLVDHGFLERAAGTYWRPSTRAEPRVAAGPDVTIGPPRGDDLP